LAKEEECPEAGCLAGWLAVWLNDLGYGHVALSHHRHHEIGYGHVAILRLRSRDCGFRKARLRFPEGATAVSGRRDCGRLAWCKTLC